MVIRHLKEFYSIVDMLISTIVHGDTLDISLSFSGIISRCMEEEMERIHVSSTLAKISVEFNDSGLTVGSITSKSVAEWLSKSTQKNTVKTNSYLSFLTDIDELTIHSIILNGQDVLKTFESAEGHIDLTAFCSFITSRFMEEESHKDIKVSLSNGSKTIALNYQDLTFLRLIKSEDKHTLYVNTESSMRELMKKNYLAGFSYCYGMPSVTTQVRMFEKAAIDAGCSFKVHTVR